MAKAYTPKRGPFKGIVFRSYYAYRRDVLGYNPTEQRMLLARGISNRDVRAFQRERAERRLLWLNLLLNGVPYERMSWAAWTAAHPSIQPPDEIFFYHH